MWIRSSDPASLMPSQGLLWTVTEGSFSLKHAFGPMQYAGSLQKSWGNLALASLLLQHVVQGCLRILLQPLLTGRATAVPVPPIAAPAELSGPWGCDRQL